MSTAFIIFFIVFAIGITFCDEHLNDEMYCKRFHQKFQICRKCPNMEEDCETSLPTDSCQCDHIQLYKQDGFIGGADCNSTLRNRPYCYVSKCLRYPTHAIITHSSLKTALEKTYTRTGLSNVKRIVYQRTAGPLGPVLKIF